MPVLTEAAGIVRFGDLIEGVTVTEQVDEVTGRPGKSVTEAQDPELRPHITLEDERGQVVRSRAAAARRATTSPSAASLAVGEGAAVVPGDVLARIPRETMKTRDITGGLPRVAELFEARLPREHAVIPEIDGVVSFGRDVRRRRRLVVTPAEGEPREYLVPRGRHLLVREGDGVRRASR